MGVGAAPSAGALWRVPRDDPTEGRRGRERERGRAALTACGPRRGLCRGRVGSARRAVAEGFLQARCRRWTALPVFAVSAAAAPRTVDVLDRKRVEVTDLSL